MSDEPRWALLSADTDRTQDYVFESARLPEIRGASRQLDDLNVQITEMVKDKGGKVILAGGGGLLAWVTPDVADDLVLQIEAAYPQKTTIATITADWRGVTAQMREQGYPPAPEAPFGSLVRWAGTWLRRKKERRTSTPFLEALPHVERCRSCQIRPAHPEYSYPNWPLCKVCHDKRIYTGRDLWFRDFQAYLDKSQALCDRYYQGEEPFPRFDAEHEQARWTSQDLNEMGQACAARPGYVGLIYLDGDGMGEAFEQADTEQAYKALSNAVRQAAESAVMDALARCLHPAWVIPSPARREVCKDPPEDDLKHGRMRIHPFDIITIGGDDVLLIVPADVALQVAVQISRSFQDRVRDQLQPADVPEEFKARTYTMSGGVVLAADHNPVRVLRDLAQELKDEAKKARKQAQAGEGYIDFLVLKSADMVERDVRWMRKQYPYQIEVPDIRPLCLLGRPYPASVLGALWRELTRLHDGGFPNSQMAQLAESLLRGRHESTLFYLYQRARDSKGHFVHLDGVLRAVQGGSVQNPTPWTRWPGADHRYSFQTALWDIAELYGFVGSSQCLWEEADD